MASFRMMMILSLTTASAVCGIAALRANEVVDFWREESSRSNRSGAARTSPSGPSRDAEAPSRRARTKVTIWPKRDASSNRRDAAEREEKRSHREGRRRSEERRAREDERESSGSRSKYARGNVHCVRTCDGYYFPANMSGSSDENRKACSALCPGAETEPYRLGINDEIDDAVSTKGKTYSSLPTAFSYRTALKDGCSCGARTKTSIAALQEDVTLVPNDIVVTETGINVFVGGAQFPYRERDFVPYRKVRGIDRAVATYLHSLEKAQLKSRRTDAVPGGARKSRVSETRRGNAASSIATSSIAASSIAPAQSACVDQVRGAATDARSEPCRPADVTAGGLTTASGRPSAPDADRQEASGTNGLATHPGD